MQPIKAETIGPELSPACWVAIALILYGVFYFTNGLVFEHMHVADGADNLVMFSYQFSGLQRGEYPLWNPLNRTGEPLYLMQALFMANPISNITIVVAILLGIKNIFLAFLIYNFILTALYVIGIYQIVFTFTKNHYSSAFGGILGLGSGTIFFNMFTNTELVLICSVPWICYGLIRYFQSYHFKYLTIFILALVVSIYSYEIVYTLGFLFLVSIATFIVYPSLFSFDILRKIPKLHLYFFLGAMLIGSFPMALIVFKAFDGSYLPPGTRFDVANMTIGDGLDFNVKTSFNKLNKFFFTCENCMTTLFTGAFWGNFAVSRHYIGPLVFPFLMVALYKRTKVVYCISLAGLLVSMLAGDIFPMNTLYNLPLMDLIKYGVIFNLYLKLLIIILASLGFHYFFSLPSPSQKTCIVWSCVLVVIACASLVLVLPRTPISTIGLLMSSIVSFILVFLAYHYDTGSFKKFSHIVLGMGLMIGVIYHYNVIKIFPILKGMNYKQSEFYNLMSRFDHSLKFLHERSDHLLVSNHAKYLYGPSSMTNEYFSFIELEENTYAPPIGKKGMSAFPILKDHLIFRSIPGSDLLLRKKFFLFEKVFFSTNPDYFSDLSKKPELMGRLIDNKIGVVDFPGDPEHPAYIGPLDFDAIKFSKEVPSAKTLGLDVKEFNANSVKLNISNNKPGLLVYTDTWDEGWHAKINGNSVPVVKVFNTYKGIELNAGEHEIEFYFSNSVLSSLIIFNIAYFALLVFVTVDFIISLPRNTRIPLISNN
jgi:hypothetical protein